MSKTLGLRIAAVATAAILALSACGDSSTDSLEGEVVKDGLGCTVKSVDRVGESPEIGDFDAEVSEVTTKDVVEAGEDGCVIGTKSYATLDMVGAKASDGSVFIDTYAKPSPLNVQLDYGQLLDGLEGGLAEMRVGSRRQIVLPAAMAYGADGFEEQGIGPDEALVFVVDLVAVTDEPTTCNEMRPITPGREGKPTTINLPAKPWTELSTEDVVVGDGEVAPRDSYVKMEYLGVGCYSGAQFDSSWDRDAPLTVTLGDIEPIGGYMSVIPGWTEGIEGMKVGGVRQINIPAELAYGAQGSPPDIGPNEPLVFVVELVDIVTAEEAQAQADAEAAAQSGATAEVPETADTTPDTAG